MKIPRDLSGEELVRLLLRLGYIVVRQTGGHIRLTTTENGEHHITIPDHSPLHIGTLAGILGDIALHFQTTREDLLERLLKKGR